MKSILSSITVRLEQVDQPDIVALIEALDDFQKPLYPAESHHGIDLAALASPDVLFAVAREPDGTAIACGALVMQDGWGELKRMYTLPTARGRGIARSLLSFLERTAAHRGIRLFRLETGYLQPDAIRLYERAGYVRRGPFGAYTDDPNSVFMEKPGLPAAYRLRLATLADVSAMASLIARSAREVGQSDYSADQIEGALAGAFGVDTQLLRDGTYFAIVYHEQIVAVGGWSHRATLFGSDARQDRADQYLDPKTDAARIRAFFVDPAHTRRGLATALLHASEAAARAHGFTRFALVATLTGRRLYEREGYVAETPIHHALPGNQAIEFIPMVKYDPA